MTARANAQYYEAGSPWSSIVSAQSLGMGGAGVALISGNAAATIANPGQLGIFSMRSRFNVSTNIAGFLDPHQPLDFSAINMGTSLNKLWPQLPVKTSLGIGYSNATVTYRSLSFGFFMLNNITTGSFNGLSAGIGFDYYVKLGLGYTFKWIDNMFYSTNQVPLKETAEDFGAVLQVPVTSFVFDKSRKAAQLTSGIEPNLDLDFGYAMRNFGGYINPYWLLPREANLGWSINAGLTSRIAGHRWEWLSISWSEQAGTSPVTTDSTIGQISLNVSGPPDTTWNFLNRYEKGLGRFGIWQSLIIGRASASVGVARGAQIGIGEFVYLRAGDITYAGDPSVATFGWGIRLDGFLKCLVFFHDLNPQSPVAKFLLDHVNLEYDFGRVFPRGFYGGQKFEDLNLVIR